MATIIKPVAELMKAFSTSTSKRFSNSDFQAMTASVVTDITHCAIWFKGVDEVSSAVTTEKKVIANRYHRFLNKFLMHAGFTNSVERRRIIESFTPTVEDLKWVEQAVDEAGWLYQESRGFMRFFRHKPTLITVYPNGYGGFYKRVINREQAINISRKKAKKK